MGRNALSFQGPGRKARSLATTRHAFLLALAGVSFYPSEAIFFRPRYALRKIDLGLLERGYPAGACGAIGLSFRALARIVSKFRSTNWEMILKTKHEKIFNAAQQNRFLKD